MATLTIADNERRTSDVQEIEQFLSPFGIWYEHWAVEGRLTEQATADDILQEYAPEIERLKTQGGYVTADVINVAPDTPNLDAMLAKFDKEHTHSEDEVRFTVEGRGVFWVNPENGPVFSIEVEAGDLINVPAGVKHWFHLCDDRHIRCIRLFQDPTGWTPEYIDQGVHEKHPPVCWGNSYLPSESKFKPPVEL
ncbi:1,2-dihydroxy-3-keto-5-methylthiopentene dioxygenase [Aeoliella mucimassa]|uniref:Acireductone dioxygenase n=1 Tax=Aeoliella mucimassa TaxID=2527972 RepID=A0A518AKY8_9BACT|nr:cupin domain-containing protein [Aeoliella mucimassa]QDU55371.1 Acireductone dioxygenase [Aeoliella mucimassa]